VRAIG
jgi:hypothetical protein